MGKRRNESWREYMTEKDYKMLTEHMCQGQIEDFNKGLAYYDNFNLLVGFGSYGIIMPWNVSKEEIAERRKNLPELWKFLKEERDCYYRDN